MQHDKSPDDLRVGPWIPAPRAESTAQSPPPSQQSSPTVPLPRIGTPAGPINDETVVLPVFVTGKKPERPPAQQAMAETTLPASERGMLLFVAALLGLGTVAVVAMMGLGLAGGSGKKATHPPARTPGPSATLSVAAALPIPAPASSVAGHPSAVRSSAAARHASPSATVSQLGTLSNADVAGYCQGANQGVAITPGPGHPSWVCVGNHPRTQQFTPVDVCQWRFHDNGAKATVGELATPSTWRCYR